MRVTAGLLVITLSLCAAPVAYQRDTYLLLAPGAKTVTVYHADTGSTPAQDAFRTTISFKPGAGERVKVWFDYEMSTPEGDPVACADPCEIYVDRRFGRLSYWFEYVDSNGDPLSPRKLSQRQFLPALESEPRENWTLPIEVIGFTGYTQSIIINIPSGTDVSGTKHLYLHVHSLSYPNKMSFRFNGGEWVDVNDSNVIRLDRALNAGSWGGGLRTVKVAVPIPSGALKVGQNVLTFRFNKMDIAGSSGYRIIGFNITESPVSITSVTVNNGVATAICATDCGLEVGDEFAIHGISHYFWRMRRKVHTVASTPTSNTITFDVSDLSLENRTHDNFGLAHMPITIRKHLLPQSAFSWDDPAQWIAPAGGDPERGELLFHAAQLKDSGWVGNYYPNRRINAKCASCHAQKGRDLQFFAFSNWSIIVNSIHRGLTPEDGRDIAAYIRSNASNAPRCANARPWNPPYQPGPGLDSGPAACWAAGAGLDYYLEYDGDMLEFMEPLQIDLTAKSTQLNVRETPIPIQLPDILHWWPTVAPEDFEATGGRYPVGNFTQTKIWEEYQWLRTHFEGSYADPTRYTTTARDHYQRMISHTNAQNSINVGWVQWQTKNKHWWNSGVNQWSYSPEQVKATYSYGQWFSIKNWELMHEFGLEQLPNNSYPTTSEPRQWYTINIFDVSPNLLGVNPGSPQLKWATHDPTMSHEDAGNWQRYVSLAWYWAQFVLSPYWGNTGYQRPMDWQYTYGFFFTVANDNGYDGATGLMMTMFLIKGLHAGHNNNGGPEKCPDAGFCWGGADIVKPVAVNGWARVYRDLPDDKKREIVNRVLYKWYEKVTSYSIEAYCPKLACADDTLIPGWGAEKYLGRFWMAIPRYRMRGYDSTILQKIHTWFQKMWPGTWTSLPMYTTCGPSFDEYSCVSDFYHTRPIKVGYRTISFQSGGTTYTGSVWYPATSSATESSVDYGGITSTVAVNGQPHIAEAEWGRWEHPVLVFSHHEGGCAYDSAYLAEALAKIGYVVAAINHKEDAAVSCGGDAGSAHPGYGNPGMWSDQTVLYRKQGIQALLDWLEAQKNDQASFLYKYVRTSNLGAIGVGLGGYTIAAMTGGWSTWTDSRIKAAYLLSPYLAPFNEPGRTPDLTIPAGIATGTADSAFGGAVSPFYANAMTGPSKLAITFNGVDHTAFLNAQCSAYSSTTDCLTNNSMAASITNYVLDFAKVYVGEDMCDLNTTADSNVANLTHAVTTRCVIE